MRPFRAIWLWNYKSVITLLTSRISISLGLLLIVLVTLFGSGFPIASSSTWVPTESPLQLVGQSTPYLKLQEGRDLRANYQEAATLRVSSAMQSNALKPLALASDDFDRDGFPDLICGYATSSGGTITVHRGDKRAFAPEDPEVIQAIAQSQFPDPFIADVRTYDLSVAPDFIGTGDFNRDGLSDLVVAARGGNALYLFEGDGQAAFIAKEMHLPGSVTAMLTGEINNQDGLADVIIAINSVVGPSMLVYDSRDSILGTIPTEHALPAQASSLAIGRLDEDQLQDVAIIAGGQVLILHGRDNSVNQAMPSDRNAGRIVPLELQFIVNALAVGEFIWDRDGRVEIAMLAEGGAVRIAARGDLDTRPMTDEEILEARRQMARERENAEIVKNSGAAVTPHAAPVPIEPLSWVVIENISETIPEALASVAAAVSGDGSSQPVLLSARLSALPTDDLLIVSPATRQIQIIYSESQGKPDTQLAAQFSLRSSVALESDGEPIAVLPMRLDVMAQPGLVVLKKGQTAPEMVLAAPSAIFTVTSNTDSAAAASGSLRRAIIDANASVGADMITFTVNAPILTIPGSDNAAAEGDLDINDSTTIMGNGSGTTIIDTNYVAGCGDCKVFGVNQSGTFTGLAVSFNGVTIQDGFNDHVPTGTFQETGGGIDFFLTGTGVVYSMINCVVTSNVATNAVNSANSYGGGINIDSGLPAATNHGSVTLTGSTISSNQSDSTGGGLSVRADLHNVTINSSVITGNTTISNALGVGAQGGGIDIRHTNGGTVLIQSASTISNNTARGQGGGICSTEFNLVTNITVANSTISGNTSQNSGGPGLPTASAGGGYFVSGNTVMLNTVNITGNHSDLSGAGTSSGGGLFVVGGTITYTGGSLSNNTANGPGGRGGGLTTNGGTLTMSNITISGNSATTNGGGVFVNGTGISPLNAVLNITGGSISSNTSLNGAGLATDTISTGATTITNASISSNTGTTNGGGLLLTSGILTLNGVTVDANTATNGDGIHQTGGTFNGQNTINFNSGDSVNLTGGTFNSTAGTMNLTGNFTNSGGSFVHNTGTVVFNGGGPQSLGGTTSSTFNNLTVNKGGGTLTLGVNTSLANVGGGGNLSVSAGIFDLSTFTINRAAAGGTLTVSNGATLKIGGTNTLPSNYNAHSIGATSTIEYSGAGQNVATLNSSQKYGNLVTSGSASKTLAGAIGIATSLTIGAGTTLDVSASNFAINIAGNWTNNGTFNPRSGTVTFDATGGTQTLAGTTTFFDLTLNNPGATTNFGSTSTTISRNLVTTAGTMNGGTSTIIFTGNPGAISGANAKNFNNLVINSGAVVSNSTGGNINIGNDYTNNGTFTQAAGLITTFTTGDGTHSLLGGGTTTFGNVGINGSTTVDAGSHSFNVVGASFDVTGTFTGNTSTTTFNGNPVAQAILGSGNKNFGGLTINNANGVTVNNVASAVDAMVAGALTLTTDLSIASGAILQQSGTSAGVADAIGTVRRTDLNTTPRAFGNPNVTISVESGTAPNPMDVTLAKIVPPDFTTAVTRTYSLTPTGGSGISATVKLHYLDPELNGNAETKLALWKKVAGIWVAQGRTGVVDTVNNSASLAGVTGFSDWTLAAVEPVTIVKAFGAASIPLNGVTTLTLTLTNPNTTTSLNGISFSDNFPAGLQVANPAGIASTCSGTWNATPGDTTLNFGGGTLAPGAPCTLTVNVTGTTVGTKSNTTNAPDAIESGTGLPSNTAILNVVAPPTISKAFGAATIPLGGTTSLTFTITNPNPSTNLTGVGFTDILPAGLTVVTSGPTATCGGTLTTTAPGTIMLSGATVNQAGGTCVFSVTVTGAAAGVQNNTSGAVTSTEGGTGNTAMASVNVVAPPAISKVFNPTSISLGGTSTLTFTIDNPNSTVALTGVAVTDILPAGLEVVTSGPTPTCGGTLTTTSPSTITLSGATIAASGSCVFSVTVTGTTSGVKTNTTGAVTSTNGGTGNMATAMITVATPPTVSKAFGVSSVLLGGTTSLTFTLNNPNTSLALTGVNFTDTLPAGITVATSGPTPVCGGTLTTTAPSTITFTGGTLAALEMCQFAVTVTGSATGVWNNTTGVISSTESGAGATSNTATLTVVGAPSIAKAFDAATIPLGGTSVLTFTITNPNTTTILNGVAFTDVLPAGLTVADGSSPACSGGTVTTTAPDTITLSGGSIPAGGSCQIMVTVTGATAGVKNNTTGAVTATNGGTGNTAMASITVVAPPVISKAFNPTNIPLGGTSTLTFTIDNPNSTVALTGVAVTDILPAGLEVVTSGPTPTCGGTLTTTSPSTITLSGATIAASGSCVFSVTVTGTTPGVKTNTTGAVTSANGGTGNMATAMISVATPPTVSKAFGVSSVLLSGTTSLTFTLNNPNTSLALTGVSFTDTLPAGITVATSGPTAVCGGTLTTTAPSTITFTGGTLAVLEMCQFAVTITGSATGVWNNTTGAISSTESGAGATSNTATLTVVGPPSIAKAFDAATIPLGGTSVLTFTITNPNPTTILNGVAFTDVLPAGLTVVTGSSPACSGGTVTTTAPDTITLSAGSIPAGGSCQIMVTVTGATAGVKNNTTGAVTATNGGTGNTAMATITVVAPPVISKAFNPTSIPLGGTSTLTFTIDNPNSTVALTGVAVTDILPAGLEVVTSGPTPTCGGTLTTTSPSTITLSGATIAASASCVFSVTVTGTTPGVKTNTTGAVTSANGGTGNMATAMIAVATPPTLTKAFGVSSVLLGGTTSLTFTMNNPNTSIGLTGVSFTDTLPAGITVGTSGPTPVCGGTLTTTAPSTITFTGGTLAALEMCQFAVTVTGSTTGVWNNTTGVISSTESGAGATSNTATLTVVGPPSIAKAFDAATIPLGSTSVLTFTITNPNTTTTLNGVAFTDVLPAGLTVVNGSSPACGGGTVTTTAPATISFSGGSIAPSGSCQIMVTVTGATAGVKNNTSGTVTATNGGTGNVATASITVVAPPVISKAFNPTNISLGGTSTLTFTIDNPNSTVALTGVAVTDILPAGLEVVTSGPTPTCGGTLTTTSPSTITLSGATIAASASCVFSVTVTGTTPGVKTNTTGAVTSANGGTGNVATAMIAVATPPTLTKAFGVSSVLLGGTTSLTFTMNNPNTSIGLTGVSFTDTLPAGITVATSGPTAVCGGTLTTTAPSTITFTGGTLAALETCQFAVTVTGSTTGVWDNTTGVISSTESGPGATSNTATLTVVGPPSIAKAFDAATIPLGGTSVLTFTITNPNTTTILNGVAFTDVLPAGLTVVNGSSPACGKGTVTTTAPNTITLSGGSIPASGSCQIMVTVTGATAGVKNNVTGAVTATNGGTGNTAMATITVVAPPVISKAFGAVNIPPNGTTSLMFTITNPNSTVALTGVAVTDVLPAGLTVASSGPTPTCGGTLTTTSPSTITLSGATIAASDTCMFSVTVTGATPGTKINTTGAVTSANGGTGNMATATVVVDTPPVALCKDVTVPAGPTCTADASIDNGSFDPDMGDTITLSQSPPGPYPLGSTLVTLTVTDNHGVSSQCQGTVTVVDTTPPMITCPSSITTKTPQPGDPCVVVTYSDPVVTDNCPLLTVVCTPPSGSCFPVGTTTVNCTATDGSGNTATCTFSVNVFDLCLQDDGSNATLLINSATGDYRFCCNGVIYTGRGTILRQGNIFKLTHNPADRRVLATDDESTHKGTASIQAPPGTQRCTITDRDTQNNSCVCQ